MKHFEQLWNEAEKLSLESHTHSSTDELAKELQEIALAWVTYTDEQRAAGTGTILYQLCALSARLRVNTFAALQEAIQDEKTKILDPEI